MAGGRAAKAVTSPPKKAAAAVVAKAAGAAVAAAAAAPARPRSALTGKSPASKKPAAVAAAVAAATGPAGEIPLLIPDRLPPGKLIVELEDAGEGGRADLAGDAGVVGRLLAGAGAAPSGAPALTLDLKGVLYRATLVPTACTLAVVAVTGESAKIETVARSFARLEADAAADADDDGRGLFDDDDEPYEVAAVSQAATAVAPGKAVRGKKRAGAGAGRGRGRGRGAKRVKR